MLPATVRNGSSLCNRRLLQRRKACSRQVPYSCVQTHSSQASLLRPPGPIIAQKCCDRSSLAGMSADDVRLELVRGRHLSISGHQSSPKKADSGDRMLTVFDGGFLGPISIGMHSCCGVSEPSCDI